MKTIEPDCVIIKRKGAERVTKFLTGKSLQEELNFWNDQTNKLINMLNKSVQQTPDRRR